MPASVIVWDIETVPDLRGFAAANGLIGKLDDEVRAEMGDKFPKLIYHSIVCIGALVAQRQEEHWLVSAVGAPHIGERPEKEIISAFVNKSRISLPNWSRSTGLPSTCRSCAIARRSVGSPRRGWHCVLTSIVTLKTRSTCATCCPPSAKPSLHELCRVMGLPGKPDGIGGADVERWCREGRVAEVAAYCETDVVNTYRVWLRYELFRGRLTENGLRASEAS